jgi:hypothetical protein
VELGEARVCEERQVDVEFTVSTTGGGNGGSACGKARGSEVSSFIGARALWRGSWSRCTVGCGMGQGQCERRWPIASRGRRCARTAATPLGGRRGGREHVAHRERVGMAVRRGRSHGARTGGR